MDLQNKKITIMGLGLHGGGLGAALFLASQGARLTITDLKTAEDLSPSLKKLRKYDKQIVYVLGRHRFSDFQRADMIVKNPDVPPESDFLKEARKRKIPIESDLSLFFKLCPAKILGVTGTRGKSTTISMVYEIMKRQDSTAVLGGNIRQSPLLALRRIKPDTPVALELSSWQTEDLGQQRLSPAVAILTSIFPDHLNRHRTMKRYIEAKANIFRFQKKDDTLVINHDFPVLKKLAKQAKGHKLYFSMKKKVRGAYLQRGYLYCHQAGKPERLCSRHELQVKGDHNVANALAAAAGASAYGFTAARISNGLKSFTGLADRQELVRKWQGVSYINDTTSTIPESTVIALDTVGGDIVLIAGGSRKGVTYGKLAEAIGQKVRILILLEGEASQDISAALVRTTAADKVTTLQAANMSEAVRLAKQNARRNGSVILSPAAASFGMFTNEFDRSRQFRQAVRRLR